MRFTVHLLKQSPLVVAGFALMFAFILIAIFAPVITPYGPEERIWTAKMLPPSSEHFFGTDESGGDVFSRIIWASRIDLTIAVTVVGMAVVIGSAVGSISGYLE